MWAGKQLNPGRETPGEKLEIVQLLNEDARPQVQAGNVAARMCRSFVGLVTLIRRESAGARRHQDRSRDCQPGQRREPQVSTHLRPPDFQCASCRDTNKICVWSGTSRSSAWPPWSTSSPPRRRNGARAAALRGVRARVAGARSRRPLRRDGHAVARGAALRGVEPRPRHLPRRRRAARHRRHVRLRSARLAGGAGRSGDAAAGGVSRATGVGRGRWDTPTTLAG